MKNNIFALVACLSAMLLGCQKEALETKINYDKVNKIVLKGQMTDLEGRPIFRGIVQTRFNSTQFPRLRYTDLEGKFALPIDTVAAFIENKSVNFSGSASLYVNCDVNTLKCSEDPRFRMPFSLFKESQRNDTLFLEYNLKLTPCAQAQIKFTGAVMDSVRYRYPINFCTRINFADYTIPFYPNNGFGIDANYPVEITISGIKNGKVVQSTQITETLKPLEIKNITIDFKE